MASLTVRLAIGEGTGMNETINWRKLWVIAPRSSKLMSTVLREGYHEFRSIEFNADGSMAAWPGYTVCRPTYAYNDCTAEEWAALPIDWTGFRAAVENAIAGQGGYYNG